jgi:hypothetical protein
MRPTLQEYLSGSKRVVEAAPAAPPVLTPELKQIYDDLMKAVDGHLDHLHKLLTIQMHGAVASQPAPAPTPEPAAPQRVVSGDRLPWFRHGVKGFVNKLWHGDHPNNPDWYRRESVMTLEDYRGIREAVEDGIESLLLVEFMVPVEVAVRQTLDKFKSDLAQTVQHHLVLAANAAKAAAPAAKTPQPDPSQMDLFSDKPAAAPTPAPTAAAPDPAKDQPPGPPEAGKKWVKKALIGKKKGQEWVQVPATPPAKPDTRSEDKVYSDSIVWYNTNLPVNGEDVGLKARRQNRTLRTKLEAMVHDGAILPKFKQEAADFMNKMGLDPKRPEHVRLIWPDHANAPLDAVAVESYDGLLARRMLEGTSLETKKLYYRYLLEYGC